MQAMHCGGSRSTEQRTFTGEKTVTSNLTNLFTMLLSPRRPVSTSQLASRSRSMEQRTFTGESTVTRNLAGLFTMQLSLHRPISANPLVRKSVLLLARHHLSVAVVLFKFADLAVLSPVKSPLCRSCVSHGRGGGGAFHSVGLMAWLPNHRLVSRYPFQSDCARQEIRKRIIPAQCCYRTVFAV
ncbi:MAG: hypothetical protein K2X55_13115 [Burkholderiaceae bacterium]|nr:hypothetical protein [Burkholderiaceae bacterium]